MSAKPTKKRRERGSIDPELVLDGAFEVATRNGLDGLSMPGLAAHLGVGVTSIYWHFQSKEGLLRRMCARAILKLNDTKTIHPKAESAPQDWRAFLCEHFTNLRSVYAGDNLLTELTIMRTATYSSRSTRTAFTNVESILSYLVQAGFRPQTAWSLWASCSMFTRGFIIAERNRRVDKMPPDGLLQVHLLDPEMTPLIVDLIRNDSTLSLDGTGDRNFTFGLDAMLDAA